MKRTNENIVSSFFYYMWNKWGTQEECKQVFGYLSEHFWEKWESLFQRYHGGAVERFYAELSDNNRRLLVERACIIYDGHKKMVKTEEQSTAESLAINETIIRICPETGRPVVACYEGDDNCLCLHNDTPEEDAQAVQNWLSSYGENPNPNANNE